MENRRVIGNIEAAVITRADELSALKSGWEALHAKEPSLSFFTSYEFIWTTCQHFLSASDRPFIVALYGRGELVAVVPLCFSRKRFAGIPYVAVDHLGCREGYSPGVSTLLSREETWRAVAMVLQNAKIPWHVLQLAEVRAEDAAAFPWRNDARFSCFMVHDRVGFQINLRDTFDQYLASRARGARRDYRKSLRLTEERQGILRLCEYYGARAATDGLDRYTKIEEKSHKAGAKITLLENSKRLNFYRSLCRTLPNPNEAQVIILRAGETDVAGMLLFIHGSKVYGRETVFDQEFSSLSPGILLRVEAIKRFCGRGFDAFDMLGMHPRYGAPLHKTDWATAKQDTFKFMAVAKQSRLMPWLWLNTWRNKEGLLPASRTPISCNP